LEKVSIPSSHFFLSFFPWLEANRNAYREVGQGRTFCVRRVSGRSEAEMYCARHDFGTYALSRTGNLAAVMKTMGHKDVKTAMQYQHPELESVRMVINDRNSRNNLRHKNGFSSVGRFCKSLKRW
jgi:site-specific recombinase XerC